MKSFGRYISRHLAYFAAVILALLLINILVFGWTFQSVVTGDYRENSPAIMLEAVVGKSTLEGISGEMAEKLHSSHIWAMFLTQDGRCAWSVDLPEEVPEAYTVGEVAAFSRGYLADYPVFVRNREEGLLVLGYPKDSYAKLTGNYYSVRALQKLPAFGVGILAVDLLLLFLAWYFSKRKIIRSTEPVMAAIMALSDGEEVSVCIRGELAGLGESVNRVSEILRRQNRARADWIRGLSHDIRTPLSMVMGYAERIAGDEGADAAVREQAEIISRQSVKIRELVQDLNLVSRLLYEAQPLHLERIRPAKMVRACAAEALNTQVSDAWPVSLGISPDAEAAELTADARLLTRALSNLVQNSIRHNPGGCEIRISLTCTDREVSIAVMDNGVGVSAAKLRELEQKPHYLESTQDDADVRHGLGLLIVRQITKAHGGTVSLEGEPGKGCQVSLTFPKAG